MAKKAQLPNSSWRRVAIIDGRFWAQSAIAFDKHRAFV